jgi:tRNA(Ile)-lysidine synthase
VDTATPGIGAMNLIERVKKTIESSRMLAHGDHIVVAVSGGPDSLCLLHVLLQLREEYALVLDVAHLNHQLRGVDADQDAAFVARVAADWGLPAYIEARDVAALARRRGLAIEEAARQARYAFLGRVARQVGAQSVAVGHNADDQVETVCMHWLRGSGLAGLRGMQIVSRFEDLRLTGEEVQPTDEDRELLLVRPLLEIPRSEIEAYCAEHKLEPRFDRSNLDTTYYRNRLRHELLPFLETFNPRIREVILRSTAILSADHACLRDALTQAWSQVVLSTKADAIQFDLKLWRALPLSLQRSTLREAIRLLRRSLRNINWVHVENAVRVLRDGQTGSAVTLPSGLEARLSYGTFTIAARGYAPPMPDWPSLSEEVELAIPGVTPLPGSGWYLHASIIERGALDDHSLRHAHPWQAYIDQAVAGNDLHLRPRTAGDRFWPQGLGDKPTTVNNFMTNAKIPRAWRDHIPLLVSPRQVLWMAGWRIDERAKVTGSTARVLRLSFERDLVGPGTGQLSAQGH